MTTGHYDELTWLDFVEEDLPTAETSELAAHLARCATCKRRVAGLRRLSDALPLAGQLLGFLPVETPTSGDLALLARSRERADRERAVDAKRDREVATWFAGDAAARIPDGITPEDVAAALRVARELLRSNPAQAAPIVRWAHDTVTTQPGDSFRRLAGPVYATFGQLLLAEGHAREALAELDRAQPFLIDAPDSELEEARWHYVRATALYQSSKYDDALESARHAAALYQEWEDDDRWRRSRILEAAILSVAGRGKDALPIYDELLGTPWPGDDRSLEAICALNYAADLRLAGHLDEVKPVLARAISLARKAGQEHLLFRVRMILADLAQAQGRPEEALKLNLRVRKEFQARTLPWDEVQRELRIAEVFLILNRNQEARATCEQLVQRARELDLPVEARRALDYLSQIGDELALEPVARVLRFVTERSRNPELIWTAA
jgi:tetratricopeptide (TPR) repeat protein